MPTTFKKITIVVPTKHLDGTTTTQQFVSYYLYVDSAKASIAYDWLKQQNCEIGYFDCDRGEQKGYRISGNQAIFRFKVLPESTREKLTNKFGLVEKSY